MYQLLFILTFYFNLLRQCKKRHLHTALVQSLESSSLYVHKRQSKEPHSGKTAPSPLTLFQNGDFDNGSFNGMRLSNSRRWTSTSFCVNEGTVADASSFLLPFLS